MQFKLLGEGAGQRIFVVILVPEEAVVATLTRFVREQDLTAASVTAIGAFRRATLGFFDLEQQDYHRIELDEQCEVLSLLGDCALDEEGSPSLHLHVVLGMRNGEAKGGHLIEALVQPTLEVIIKENTSTMVRTYRPEFGIALIDPLK
ncbi:PPC domain-containing DNA-binding protein [Ochrobactrum sp. A-1]|uniref:PPC domain-containing DNA-binding protein n=1 Tax=Ochrobactrum sp. A-1 TaxID=2920940 RepID=UPI001F0A0961|nr:DNA-binding protein [Ochrobactrum sp. A-1]